MTITAAGLCDSGCDKGCDLDRAVCGEYISVFDVFKFGLGPSSSHTNGPMFGSKLFVDSLRREKFIPATQIAEGAELPYDRSLRVVIDLYGSLATTGKGHRTDVSVVVGLLDWTPDVILPDVCQECYEVVRNTKSLALGRSMKIDFDYQTDLNWNMHEEWPQHPNAMKVSLLNRNTGETLHEERILSIGGGFIKTLEEYEEGWVDTRDHGSVPYNFLTSADILRFCKDDQIDVAELVYRDEESFGCCSREDIHKKLDSIIECMFEGIIRGCNTDGPLPLKGYDRRSKKIYDRLRTSGERAVSDHLIALDWISLYARALNEENATGGRVITAPTNGAAGTFPAVLYYFKKFHHTSTQQKLRDMVAVAGAIATLCKRNGSISGAEAGCQAEIGSACAMASAALCHAMGGTPPQVENAAEIGLEHFLGMTCDPVEGVVVVPCIERNSMAACKAVTAARLALLDDGDHMVSLDSCIATMYQSGRDLQSKYRETSAGGLALLARDLRGRKLTQRDTDLDSEYELAKHRSISESTAASPAGTSPVSTKILA
ncbi:MAG: hypothetical protein KVP17_000957 [Porospora cf. gigantea B]|uniref:uncharacterized protein n=1 Tax=Porospora cf. gigantea B TaxID=2853592 RepID=UPI003571D899|nr:MAG: hypothetical protein KVP17_000957 [Porospora cf. gigantea B]